MAKRWVPDPGEGIGSNEPLGRRVFDDPVWRDSLQQGLKYVIRYDHFYDTRLSENLSLDRLGSAGNPSKKVIAFLKAKADREASQRNTRFEGWAYLLAKHFKLLEKPLPLRPSPVSGPLENPYHADLQRDSYREKKDAYLLALHLKQLFEVNGGFSKPE